MKKLFILGFLSLTAACQSATATLTPESRPTAVVQTPQETATGISTVIPTQSLSPTPAPRYFTENFDTVPTAWSIIQAGSEATPQIKSDGNALVFDLGSPYTWTYAIYSAQDYTDIRIDASFESRGASPESIGLVCDYSEKNGWYEFNISTDGTYNILFGHWMAPGIASYIPIANDTSEYLNRGETKYELGLMCQQNTLWLYINQKLFRKIDVARYGLTDGKVGLSVSSFENVPVISAFDWVNVSAP
jgi:hypothetical protein